MLKIKRKNEKTARSEQKQSKGKKPLPFTLSRDMRNSMDFSDYRLGEEDVKGYSTNKADKILNHFFRVKIGGKEKYMCLIAIYGIDILHYSIEDMRSAFGTFGYATRLIDLPHKYIFTHKTPDLSRQREFLEYKLSKAANEYIKELLRIKIRQLEDFEIHHNGNLAYLIIFSDKVDKLYDGVEDYLNSMGYCRIVLNAIEDSVLFFKNLLSFETNEEQENINYNVLNDYILPDSVKYGQAHFCVNGKKYITPVTAYSYPAMLSKTVFTELIYENSHDVTATWDICSIDKSVVIFELKNSMKELESRRVINEDIGDRMNTQTELEKLQMIYDSIVNGSEQMMFTTLRFYICADDLEQLRKRTKSFMKQLEGNSGIMGFININEMQSEYIGLVSELNTIRTPMPLYDTFCKQFPFYYQEHIDKTGLYFGSSQTDGLVILDTFTKDKIRTSFDLLALGLKGGGKSVTLKTMLQDQLLLGNKVMVIDIEGEYAEMCKIFDGQLIKLSKNSTINPLQIRNTIVAKVENADSEEQLNSQEEAIDANFTAEISRICVFFKRFAVNLNADDMAMMRDVLLKAFQQKSIDKTTDVTGLKATDFPLMSDLLSVVEKQLEKTTSEADKASLLRIRRVVTDLTIHGVYGTMFDAYTNVEVDNSNFIVFDVHTLSDMDDNVFNAQLFNIMSVMWSEICKNVAYNAYLVNPQDRRNVVCLFDEAHRFISSKNTLATEFILKLLRRARKYDAALWFATQSVLDFVPSESNEDTDTVRKIFSLVQYRVLLKQSSDSLETLQRHFPQFTLSELANTDSFEAGEMLLALSSGNNKIHCRRLASDCDLLYIGNSRDKQEIIYKIFNRLYGFHYNANELAEKMNNDRDYFIETFTVEVFEYFGISENCSSFLYQMVHTLVQNLTQNFIEKNMR